MNTQSITILIQQFTLPNDSTKSKLTSNFHKNYLNITPNLPKKITNLFENYFYGNHRKNNRSRSVSIKGL